MIIPTSASSNIPLLISKKMGGILHQHLHLNITSVSIVLHVNLGPSKKGKVTELSNLNSLEKRADQAGLELATHC